MAHAQGLAGMIVARREALTGQALLVVLIAITILTASVRRLPLGPRVAGRSAVGKSRPRRRRGSLWHLQMPGSRLVFLVFLLGLTLPFEGIITPLYYQVRDLGILNTRWAIVLSLIGLFMRFSVFWMRAHFVNMPRDLSEAARMDAATTWQLFWRIHVPLARPALSSLAILLFLWTWNQFLLAIVLVDDPTKRTMAGALGAFQGQWGIDIPLLCAGSLLILTPTLIVFLAFQRQFVSALLQGSLKG
jgi:raffinose/stachyose/melibiose transport system permease protein